jgi:hypothetical protein
MHGEWFLEPYAPRDPYEPGASPFSKSNIGWAVRRYMDDQIYGVASIDDHRASPGNLEVTFRLTLYFDNILDKQFSAVYRGLSKKEVLQRFRKWIWEKIHDNEKYLVNEDLFNQLQNARRRQRVRDAKVVLVRLNKDGNESRMSDAITVFSNEDDAIRAHNYRVKANPGKKIEHNLHSYGLIDMVVKLSGEVDL